MVKGGLNRGRTRELLEDVLVGHTEGLEEDGHRLATLAVDADTDLVALVDFEFEPCTAAGDDATGEEVLVDGLVIDTFEVDAGATDELRDDNTLGSVDDEGALGGHEREVTHEDGLSLDLTRHMVHELSFDIKRGGVGLAAFLALVELVLLFFEIRVREGQLHGVVLDRRDLFEDFGESGARCAVLSDEPLETFGLKSEQVRNGQCIRYLRKRHAICIAPGPLRFLLYSHRIVLHGHLAQLASV